jgi:hypothetical protein
MPKINTTSFKEGDVIRKSDITSVADEIESIDTALDEDNIREEGLDRRVFDAHPWTIDSNEPVEIRERVLLPRQTSWGFVEAAGKMVRSAHGVYPQIHIPWNTLNDSNIIIRCSFFIDSKNSDMSLLDVNVGNDDWEFGLHVTHPDQSPDAGLVLLPSDVLSGGIWPYARIGLSKAFQRDSEIGGDGENAPGAWYQHAFTKRSQISQSVTLVYHAHARVLTESVPDVNIDRSHRWEGNGTAKVTLAYRSRYLVEGLNGVHIRGMNISYQKFRR